ncbi:MAG: hypothetical protein MJZ41_07735 [Bacteroidaceae bacterium]|nr:hypothetical protein [Bacteroidaceae bacterium]
MKTISDYTTYCTPEQTKKALEFGAPIEANKDYSNGNLPETLCIYGDIINKDVYGIGECTILHIPTTCQMIGWLEEQGIQISIMFCYQVSSLRWNYDLDNNNMILFEHNSIGYPTRKEATLAAIDAALEYLTNNKK